MASRAFLITVIVAAAVAPVLAVDYMVGGNDGWNRNVSYTTWANGKDFHVGDSLMFMYTPGEHNVVKVNKTDFQLCTNSNSSATNFTTGNDVIALTAPGKKWYISTVDDDCSNGMKLVITVSKAEAPGPAPVPMPGSSTPPPGTSAAGEISALRSCVWMLAVVAAYRMIMA